MRRQALVILFLVITTGAVYWQTSQHGFIAFDDDRYVYRNPTVQAGLTREGILWAFTTTTASNWHPLTWLSHMLDAQLYGLDPGGHHLTNVLMHIANAVLLFLLLLRMTGALWRSGFVAALFALHPLHVESVAWIAERKDLLSTFFWWGTIGLYLAYVHSPGRMRFLWVFVGCALALMAKSMAVTLPFTLLLLDYWPLRRLDPGWGALWVRIREKLPLFGLAVMAGAAAVWTQHGGRALISMETFPLRVRLANAVVSYGTYVVRMVWPDPLAAYYPHPESVEVWRTVASAVFLCVVSAVVIRRASRERYLVAGWCWFLGTLVPVIGLVQVGTQAMADRYTYVPLVGLFIVAAWGIPDLVTRVVGRPAPAWLLGTMAGAVIAALTACTVVQASHWTDTATLFRHTLEVTRRNPMAHGILGTALSREGRLDEAIREFREGLRLKPDMPQMHNNLGIALFRKGKVEEAIEHYRAALRVAPANYSAHNNLGTALYSVGRVDEAIVHLEQAVRLRPDSGEAHNNLGTAVDARGRTEEAILHYREALRLMPGDAATHNNLGGTLYGQGRIEAAIRHFRAALRARPGFPKARRNLALALHRSGRRQEAVRELETILAAHPEDEETRSLLQRIRGAPSP